MKTLLALIIATVGIAAAAPSASAGNSCYRPPSCKVYTLYTKTVCSHYFTKYSYNSCGHRFAVRYKSVTYRTYYSNGTTRTFKRTSASNTSPKTPPLHQTPGRHKRSGVLCVLIA